MEVLRLLAKEKGLENIRFLGAAAAYEEIGRMGSRVLAGEFRPDVVIGVDVAHDLDAAPHVKGKRFPPVKMGAGPTLAIGSIANAYLNQLTQAVARKSGINLQTKPAGRDTGTDAMAGVFAAIDAAAISIGFPIRQMHTISECGHTGDILGAIWTVYELLHHLDGMNGGSAPGPTISGRATRAWTRPRRCATRRAKGPAPRHGPGSGAATGRGLIGPPGGKIGDPARTRCGIPG